MSTKLIATIDFIRLKNIVPGRMLNNLGNAEDSRGSDVLSKTAIERNRKQNYTQLEVIQKDYDQLVLL